MIKSQKQSKVDIVQHQSRERQMIDWRSTNLSFMYDTLDSNLFTKFGIKAARKLILVVQTKN